MLLLIAFDWTIIAFIAFIFIVSIPFLGEDDGEDEGLRG